jgi:hypothetical protein
LDLAEPAAGLGRTSEDRPAYWPGGQTASGWPRSAPAERWRARVPTRQRGLGARPCPRGAGTGQTEVAVWFLADASSRQPSVATIFRYAASSEVPSHSPVPSFPHPVHLEGFRSPMGFTRPLSRATLPGRLRGLGTDLRASRGTGDSPPSTHLERLRVARPSRNPYTFSRRNPFPHSTAKPEVRPLSAALPSCSSSPAAGLPAAQLMFPQGSTTVVLAGVLPWTHGSPGSVSGLG